MSKKKYEGKRGDGEKREKIETGRDPGTRVPTAVIIALNYRSTLCPPSSPLPPLPMGIQNHPTIPVPQGKEVIISPNYRAVSKRGW